MQISAVPDVALEANRDLDHTRCRSSWEQAIDRALNRVRTFTSEYLLHKPPCLPPLQAWYAP